MFDQWAILELMGHVRTAGRVTEEEHFGAKLGRIDVPQADGKYVTQLFGGASVYRLTLVSEEAARAVALANKPHPVQSWEMPKAIAPAVEETPPVFPETYRDDKTVAAGRDWRYHNTDPDSDGSDY